MHTEAYYLSWISTFIFCVALLSLCVIFALWQWNKTTEALREAQAEAETFGRLADRRHGEIEDLKRDFIRLATALPGRNAERERIASTLSKMDVMRAGVIAAIGEFQRTACADFSVPIADLLKHSYAVPVDGAVNVPVLVRSIMKAVADRALCDDLDAAAIDAIRVLDEEAKRGDQIFDVGFFEGSVRAIPVKRLADVVDDAKLAKGLPRPGRDASKPYP